MPDISGFQLGIGCQFVAFDNENLAIYQKKFQIHFVSNLDI